MSEPLTNRGTITLATYCAKTQVYTKILWANARLLNFKYQTQVPVWWAWKHTNVVFCNNLDYFFLLSVIRRKKFRLIVILENDTIQCSAVHERKIGAHWHLKTRMAAALFQIFWGQKWQMSHLSENNALSHRRNVILLSTVIFCSVYCN